MGINTRYRGQGLKCVIPPAIITILVGPQAYIIAYTSGCVLAPTLFGIFFATLLKHAFGESTEGIYLRTRSDGNLFKHSRLRAKIECMRNTYVTSYLQMMWPLQLTLRRTFSGFWTAFQMLVDTSDLPSAWPKHRSWGKTLRRYHRSSFTTTN